MSTSPASDSPQAPPEEQRERLSLTQVTASALATVTATAALSLFGVAGTVVGAALASVLTVVGNHLYAQSIKRTQAHVLAGTSALRTRAAVVVGDPHRSSGYSDPAVQDRTVQDRTAQNPTVQDRLGAATATRDANPQPHGRRVLDLGSRKRLLLTTLAVFVAILAAVTAFELLAGKPLSDVVRGQGGSGTSIGTHVDSPAPSTGRTAPSGSSSTSSSSSTTSSSTSQTASSSSSTDSQTSASSTSSTASDTSTTTTPPKSQSSTTATPTGVSSSSSATGAG